MKVRLGVQALPDGHAGFNSRTCEGATGDQFGGLGKTLSFNSRTCEGATLLTLFRQ